MKEVVETMLKHPFASVFVINALGGAIALIIHGNSLKPVSVRVSKTRTQTEA